MRKLYLFSLAVMALFATNVWADTEYKLIDYSLGTPALTGDFITTKSLSSANYTYTEADESQTTFSKYVQGVNKAINGQAAVDGQIYYDVKTTSAKIKIYVANSNNSNKKLYFGRASECDNYFDTTEIAKGTKIIEREVNCTEGGTRFVLSANATDIRISQVIVTEKGDVLPKFGEAGYTLTDTRVGLVKQTDYVYDGVTIYSRSDIKFNSANLCVIGLNNSLPDSYIKFTTPNNGKKVILNLTHSSSKGVIVDAISTTPTDISGYSQLASAVTSTSKVLNPNTTYMVFSINSSANITKIEFEDYVPSTDATLSAISVGAAALDLSKFEEKDGALQYDLELSYGTTEVPAVTYTLNDENATAVKTDAASVNGTTTIVVTAEDGTTTQTYKINFSVKSELGHEATLSSILLDGIAIDTFAANKELYNIAFGVYDSIPVVTYTLSDFNANAVYTPALADLSAPATIVVTAEDGTTTKTYTINFTQNPATELVSISVATTWDFTQTGSTEVKFTASTTPKKDAEFNFADVLKNPHESFNAAALLGAGEYAVRGGEYFQGNYVKFNTTVAGTMTIVYSNTGDRSKADGEKDGQESQRRFLTVNDALVSGDAGTMKQSKSNATTVEDIAVSVGNVKIGAVRPYYTDHTTEPQYLRIYSIVFTKSGTVGIDNTSSDLKAIKRIENGMLIIEKNGVRYNAMGQIIR